MDAEQGRQPAPSGALGAASGAPGAPLAPDALAAFHPAVAQWFRARFGAPTEPQVQGWPAIQARRHTLIAAPTGSGKTLAAFLAAIDDLVRQSLAGRLETATQVLYVSPLKALSADVQKNLAEPLEGIRAVLAEQGLPRPEIRVLLRTGDTPAGERAAMIKHPPHILVTTPESFFILLTSARGRELLATVRTAIVDEIHALVGDKRGSHLALSLERLEHLVRSRGGPPLTRIGLSATQKPIAEVAHFLVGAAGEDARATSTAGEDARAMVTAGEDARATMAPPPCTIVDAGHVRRRDLAIELPGSPLETVMSAEVWTEVYGRLADLIEQHRTTLVFVNTRRLAERVARHLSERLGEGNVTAHHGSMSREHRLDAEQRLKAGRLRALVATASLELGIDVGAIDLVCQLGSTRSIAALLQRVGRSGHSLAGIPKGRLFPLTRDELVECAALLEAVQRS
jgi:ATP-dependent Lhr-like helicase